MDVHTTSFTLCCYSIENDNVFAVTQMKPDYKNVIKYLEQVKRNLNKDCYFLCGYEAGSLGYVLYHQLTDNNIDCVILAPTSMPKTNKKEIKTDKRDAAKIAKCLAFRTCSTVHIPTDEDNAVKEYIRMRDVEKDTLKKLKQRIGSFCTRNGRFYSDGSKWTLKHLAWLKRQNFDNAVLQETFQEYLTLYYQAADKVALFDKRIEEFASQEAYREKVKKLICFLGIKTHTALATIVETGDFRRFASAQQYSAYLGLVPGESSSGNSRRITGITKAGNSHIRKLLIEAGHSYSRGSIRNKSKGLLARQTGNDPKVIAYADKANERLKRKFYRIVSRSPWNVGVAAVARELACFIWGMMTDNIEWSREI
jgi:transposase